MNVIPADSLTTGHRPLLFSRTGLPAPRRLGRGHGHSFGVLLLDHRGGHHVDRILERRHCEQGVDAGLLARRTLFIPASGVTATTIDNTHPTGTGVAALLLSQVPAPACSDRRTKEKGVSAAAQTTTGFSLFGNTHLFRRRQRIHQRTHGCCRSIDGDSRARQRLGSQRRGQLAGRKLQSL